MEKECHKCKELQEVIDKIIKLLDLEFSSHISYLPGIVLKKVINAREKEKSKDVEKNNAQNKAEQLSIENNLLRDERDRLFEIVKNVANPEIKEF